MTQKKWYFLFIPWIVALISFFGSMFFSEIMKYPPCVLCWYQRICMFPLSLILLSGLLKFDKSVVLYSLPLAIVGWCISFYHNLLYYKFIPDSLAPCVQGISCTTVQLEWLGFITIPLMALTSFSLIISFLIYFQKGLQYEK